MQQERSTELFERAFLRFFVSALDHGKSKILVEAALPVWIGTRKLLPISAEAHLLARLIERKSLCDCSLCLLLHIFEHRPDLLQISAVMLHRPMSWYDRCR